MSSYFRLPQQEPEDANRCFIKKFSLQHEHAQIHGNFFNFLLWPCLCSGHKARISYDTIYMSKFYKLKRSEKIKKWKIKSKTIWRTAKQRLLVSIKLCLWTSIREMRKYLHSSSTLRTKRGKNLVVGPEVFNLSGITVTQAGIFFPCNAYVPQYMSRWNNVPQYLSF